MLASLEIVAPGAFGIEIPWQDHLSIARRMIAARGGSKVINVDRDRVSHFLIRCLAYLHFQGNFSSPGAIRDQSMFSGDLYEFNKRHDFTIDCMLGFSGFLAGILARIADLARQCDQERISEEGEIDPNWRPTEDVIEAAKKVEADLTISKIQKYDLCPFRHSESSTESGWETLEMIATNEAYHWAGVVHLYRRVLGLPNDSPKVQNAVGQILSTIERVRRGKSAEACLVFPLFTAGCEVKEKSQQDAILKRIESVEKSGMTQVSSPDIVAVCNNRLVLTLNIGHQSKEVVRASVADI